MLTSRRDYLVRLIEEVTQALARAVFKRKGGDEAAALQSVVQGCERLFNREADQLFQFTPDQHFLMLTEGEDPDSAAARVLLYAALNQEAGRIYAALGKKALARGSYLNALRFTLRAGASFPTEAPPQYAPAVPDLLAALQGEPPDPDVRELLQQSGPTPPPAS